MNIEKEEINQSLDKLLVNILLILDKEETIRKKLDDNFKYNSFIFNDYIRNGQYNLFLSKQFSIQKTEINSLFYPSEINPSTLLNKTFIIFLLCI